MPPVWSPVNQYLQSYLFVCLFKWSGREGGCGADWAAEITVAYVAAIRALRQQCLLWRDNKSRPWHFKLCHLVNAVGEVRLREPSVSCQPICWELRYSHACWILRRLSWASLKAWSVESLGCSSRIVFRSWCWHGNMEKPGHSCVWIRNYSILQVPLRHSFYFCKERVNWVNRWGWTPFIGFWLPLTLSWWSPVHTLAWILACRCLIVIFFSLTNK